MGNQQSLMDRSSYKSRYHNKKYNETQLQYPQSLYHGIFKNNNKKLSLNNSLIQYRNTIQQSKCNLGQGQKQYQQQMAKQRQRKGRNKSQVKQTSYAFIADRYKTDKSSFSRDSNTKTTKTGDRTLFIPPNELSNKKTRIKDKQKQLYSNLCQSSYQDTPKQLYQFSNTLQPRKLYYNYINHINKKKQFQDFHSNNNIDGIKEIVQYKRKQKKKITNRRQSSLNNCTKQNNNILFNKNEEKVKNNSSEVQKLTNNLKAMQQKLLKMQKRKRKLQISFNQTGNNKQTNKQIQKKCSTKKNQNQINKIDNTFTNAVVFRNNPKKNNCKHLSNQQKVLQTLNKNLQIQQKIKQQQKETTTEQKQKKDKKRQNINFQQNYNGIKISQKQFIQIQQKSIMIQQIQYLKKVINQLQNDKKKQLKQIAKIQNSKKFSFNHSEPKNAYVQQNGNKIKNKHKQQRIRDSKLSRKHFLPIKQIPETEALNEVSPSTIERQQSEQVKKNDKTLQKRAQKKLLNSWNKKQLNKKNIKNSSTQNSISPITHKQKVDYHQLNNIQQIKNKHIMNKSNSYSTYSTYNINPQNQQDNKLQLSKRKQFIKNNINRRQKYNQSTKAQRKIINNNKFNQILSINKKNHTQGEQVPQQQIKIQSEQIQQILYQSNKFVIPQSLPNQFHIPEISVPSIEIPSYISFPQILPQNPTSQSTQNQIIDRFKKICNIFNIKILCNHLIDIKKFKNCFIFLIQNQSNIVIWHLSGRFYVGEWNQNGMKQYQKNGKGLQILPDQYYYKGNFVEGKRHGQGTMVMANGHAYIGQWVNGQKSGNGLYYDKSSNFLYKGEWKQGRRHGHGIIKSSQKQFYDGQFDKNLKSGFGTQLFVNGDIYQGEYKNDNFHGTGKYFWTNGSVYVGNFNEGCRDGHGQWRSSVNDGDMYEGEYKNDRKSGKGKYIWFNRCTFDGQFFNDLKHGEGKIQYPDGRLLFGRWEFDNLKSAFKLNQKQQS